MKIIKILTGIILLLFTQNCQSQSQIKVMENKKGTSSQITLGAGCFWCIEAVFQDLKGVSSVVSGYTGGDTENPTYRAVASGTTGHAEVAQITYDSTIISFETILSVFFTTHDPTTLNRQGNDVGTEYRSAIFYNTEEQKNIASRTIDALNKENAYPNPIVTEVTELGVFYIAENYHQDYFKQNGEQGYCRYVIQPKVDKMKKVFGGLLK